MVDVAALEALRESAGITMHPSQAAQIAALKQDEACIKVSSNHTDYPDLFSFNLAIELPKNTGINEYAIELEDGK